MQSNWAEGWLKLQQSFMAKYIMVQMNFFIN